MRINASASDASADTRQCATSTSSAATKGDKSMVTGFTQRLRGKIDVDFGALWQRRHQVNRGFSRAMARRSAARPALVLVLLGPARCWRAMTACLACFKTPARQPIRSGPPRRSWALPLSRAAPFTTSPSTTLSSGPPPRGGLLHDALQRIVAALSSISRSPARKQLQRC